MSAAKYFYNLKQPVVKIVLYFDTVIILINSGGVNLIFILQRQMLIRGDIKRGVLIV